MYQVPVLRKTLLMACTFVLAFPFSLKSYTFERFTMEIFRREISGSTIDLHYTLAEPKAYGIEEGEPSFGSFDEGEREEELAYLEKCRRRLARYRGWGLKEEDQLTAEVLDWWLAGQIESEAFYYYQEPLGPSLGVQAQLPVLLAEYPFRSQEDIETYLELLCKLPEYFEGIAAFEQEKSRQGLFMTDEVLDQILAQCRSLFPIDRTHFLVTSFQERLDGCPFVDPDQRIAYEAENLRNLNRFVEPAYEELLSVLETLRGTGVNEHGLYHTPDGIRYYEHLLTYSVGTDLNMAEIHKLLEEQMESDHETILYALQQDMSLIGLGEEPALESPKETLERLQEQIRVDFPQTKEVAWQIKEVPDSLAGYLSSAFYLTPAIDASQQNTIYVNPSYTLDRTGQITTLAHEGYPGHLYQNSFENGADYDPVRNLFYIGGYTEGWGLYSEYYAYDLLGYSGPEGEFLRAVSSLNFAVCASLDLAVHGEGWTEEDCRTYLDAFGIRDEEQIHSLYLNILEEPSNYLKYYLGYLEICRLKESMLACSEDQTLLDFHTWFLEMGPAPFGILEEHLDAEFPEVALKLPKSPDQKIHFFALETFEDRGNHLLMECRMLPVSGCALLRQGEEYDPLVLRAADTGHIPLFHQTVDRGGQSAHGHGHGLGYGGHIPGFADADGIDDMHIIDGYFTKGAGDQSLVLQIEHVVEQHHQQVI